MEKRPLDNMATNDKGKAVITAIKYSALDRAILFIFYDHSDHFGYGLMRQVSALEN